jgi:outer membrane lipoprotein carrier protein
LSLIKKLAFTTALLIFTQQTFADEQSLGRFIQVLTSYDTLKADFSQLTMEDDGLKINEVYGDMVIRRPNQFYWRSYPPQDQEIISNGKTLWIFDRDLEQVTFEPSENRLSQSPAAILSGDRELIQKLYQVSLVQESTQEQGNQLVFQLVPNDTQSSLTDIYITVIDQNISELKFVDSLGQTTLIQLTDHQTDIRLKRNYFDFVPPKGVDVLDQSQ